MRQHVLHSFYITLCLPVHRWGWDPSTFNVVRSAQVRVSLQGDYAVKRCAARQRRVLVHDWPVSWKLHSVTHLFALFDAGVDVTRVSNVVHNLPCGVRMRCGVGFT